MLQGEEVPLADMPYPDGGSHAPPPGAFRMYPNQPVSWKWVTLTDRVSLLVQV